MNDGFREDLPISNNKDLVYSVKNERNIWNIKYSNNKSENTYIELPIFYYSGYSVISSSNKTNKLTNTDGYVKVNISDESGYLSIKYVGTKLLKIGYIVTGTTSCFIAIYFLIRYYKYITIKFKNEENKKNSCNL